MFAAALCLFYLNSLHLRSPGWAPNEESNRIQEFVLRCNFGTFIYFWGIRSSKPRKFPRCGIDFSVLLFNSSVISPEKCDVACENSHFTQNCPVAPAHTLGTLKKLDISVLLPLTVDLFAFPKQKNYLLYFPPGKHWLKRTRKKIEPFSCVHPRARLSVME